MGMLDASRVAALAEDPAPACALVECLRASGYRTGNFLATLDAESPGDLLGRTAFYALLFGDELAHSDDPHERIFAFLALGAGLGSLEYETALPLGVRAAVERCGAVSRDADGTARAAVTVVEHEGVFLFADKLFELSDGGIRLETDPVAMPPHFSTFRTLAAASRLPAARSLLDVGTGAGSVALLAGPGFELVKGLDLQPRAVAMARLNARLNRRRQLQFVVADCLTFADGHRYDRVIFNSPGEFELVDRFAGRARDLLTPGGVCVVLAWLHLPREASVEPFLAQCARRWPALQVGATVFAGSPFSATQAEIAAGRPRVGSYLTQEFLAQLRQRQVCQRVEVVLTLEASAAARPIVIVEEDGSRAGGWSKTCAYTA